MPRTREFGIIFEIIRMGDYVKVSAVDPVSLVEVSVVGPARGPLEPIKQIALQKLRRAIARGGTLS
jgi:hypothetical protein